MALAALTVVIEESECDAGVVPVAGYPGGGRPTSLVELRGRGEIGRGEHVGWTESAHEAFCARVAGMPRGRWRLGAWTAAMALGTSDPYDRAALEASAIDLALRQANTSLFHVAGMEPRPVRYVVSFERVPDPSARAQMECGEVELKIDADPAWPEATYHALASCGRVAILDFKGTGTRADHERAHQALPEALIEDPRFDDHPWSASLCRRLSCDAAVTSAAALSRLPVRPAAINLKPGRMGGVFEVLACAARCAAEQLAVYVGGMFEVSVGRAQLRDLAALLSPDGPNDLAPLAIAGRPAPRPPRLVPDAGRVGFGA
jgi:L-alanine-DL-glutamate epimerase-like enolase superfamily enzyme